MASSKDVLQQAWRKGWEQPDGFRIPCQSEAEATSLRFALYNSVKQFRGDNPKPCDDGLRGAIDNCSISIIEDGTTLVIRQSTETGMMPKLLALLGGGGGEVKSVDTLVSEGMAKRVAEATGSPTGRVTEDHLRFQQLPIDAQKSMAKVFPHEVTGLTPAQQAIADAVPLRVNTPYYTRGG